MSRGRDSFDMFAPRDRGRFGENECGNDSIRGNDSVRSDLVDLILNLKMDKPLAIAVTDPVKPHAKWVWLPKSAIEYEAKGRGLVEVTLPQRLAKEKELI